MIVKQELLKILRIPIISCLLVFFVVLNILIVINHSYIRSDLAVLTGLVDEYGHEVDAGMLEAFSGRYDEVTSWVKQVASGNESRYEHPSELLADESFRFDNDLSDKELEQLNTYGLIEHYYRTSQDVDSFYEAIDLAAYAESQIRLFGLEGTVAEEVRNQFQKLDVRLTELVANNEHSHLFFAGKLYGMHSFLFKDIGRALIFELMILVVLVTASITNYEFEQKTALISYTTKRGRKLTKDKLIAAGLANVCMTAVLMGITLLAYFLTYDYSGLWSVPISSYFNAEMSLPYIAWWNLSFAEYLGLFVLILLLSQLIFMGITFVLSVFMKNTYLVFFTFVVLLGIGIVLPSYVPLNNHLMFLVNYSPFLLIVNSHEWLMGNSIFTIHAYYEAITLTGWLLVSGILCTFSIRKFKRQQLQ